MKNWHEILVSPESTVLDTLSVIDRGAMQIALVVGPEGHLLGTVSDGDIRRGILRGIPMSDPVHRIMNQHPTVVTVGVSREEIRELMSRLEVRQIPVVDEQRRVVRLETWLDTIRHSPKNNPVVLMAGGSGQRLGALTAECPKPLLKVGNKPILQTIMESFIESGFRNFFISVNYYAEMIRNYFGDGSQWDVSIQYLHEDFPLGTAGALGLMPEAPAEPIIVMNGDILTKVDFEHLLSFHNQSLSWATMCIRDYQAQIPYGVVEIDENRLVGIREKPTQKYFVSAGIYVLDPAIIQLLPHQKRMDMPDLFHAVLNAGRTASVFPIREYWIDIGRVDDYEKANCDYAGVFG